MIKKQRELTDQHIVVEIDEQWYCIPFMILEDLPADHPIMAKMNAHFGLVGPVENWPANYCQILDRGIRKMLYRFLFDQEDPYYTILDIIKSNHDEFKAILSACKLY